MCSSAVGGTPNPERNNNGCQDDWPKDPASARHPGARRPDRGLRLSRAPDRDERPGGEADDRARGRGPDDRPGRGPDDRRRRGADDRAGGRCLVAEQRGQLVGVLLASYNAFHLFLSHVAVAPAHRRQGVGALLHDELARLARRDGAQGIIVDARLSAVGFFEALGYRTPGAVFLIRDL